MPEQSSGRRALAPALASVAGFVDAAGFLALNLFSAHMSGNSARLGVYLSGGLLSEAAAGAFAIAVFVVGIGAGTAGMEILTRARRRAPAALVLGAELVLLVILAAVGSSEAAHGHIPRSEPGVFYPLAGAAVLAMGLQTATLQRISGKTVRTTYVSGMLTNLAEEAVSYMLGPARTASGSRPSYIAGELGMHPGRSSLRRMGLIVSIWLAYGVGALAGGYLERRLSLACLAFPAAVLTALTAIEWLSPSPPLETDTLSGAAGPR